MVKTKHDKPPTTRLREDQEQKKDKVEEKDKVEKQVPAEEISEEEAKEEVYNIVGKTYNPLSSYVARPKRVNFETQFKGEEIILLLRRHIITNFGWLLFTGILVFAPLVLITFPFLDFIPGRFVFIFFLMWYMFVFVYFFENFLAWYFHVFIITDRRVVDIDFYHLAYKEISEAKIKNIVDVTMVMAGAIQTIFNFGLIKIQTAGQVPEIEFEDVPQPLKVTKVLKKLQLAKKNRLRRGRK